MIDGGGESSIVRGGEGNSAVEKAGEGSEDEAVVEMEADRECLVSFAYGA